jgi:hypothetical protein
MNMLHIATVHWRDDRWIDIQLKYLRQHIATEFKIYAFLNYLPDEHRTKFFYSSTEPIRSHASKLNLLADIAAFNAAAPEDWLMFLDGDAFPIGDVVSFARRAFERYPLMAIQRRENNGDVQPHPAFCLTTIGFWRSIRGDWKEGHAWRDTTGRTVTDVGGNLLGILEQRNIEWRPMLRSNRTDLHPLLFGLYEDVVYHHGFGFRGPGIARVERGGLKRSRTHPISKAVDAMFRVLPSGGVLERTGAALSPAVRAQRQAVERNALLHREVFDSIRRDPFFYRRFQDVGASGNPAKH